MANCNTCGFPVYRCDDCGKVGCMGRTGPGNSQQCSNAAFGSDLMDSGRCVSCGSPAKSET